MKLYRSKEVKQANWNDTPVVALETTVITHGMAYPDNWEITQLMQNAIREAGACPAICAIIDGKVTVGLSDEEIQSFAKSPRGAIAKCSRRDLPVIVGQKASGSLTVAATAMVAHAAEISIFATGGIGGVHRGHPHDVSADLLELARTPVTVVCAGAKSILDLELTLEVLETQGVPVVGLGCKNLPAFYTRESSHPLPATVKGIQEAAEVYTAWRSLDPGNGMLITVPVPAQAELPASKAEKMIEIAVREADDQGVNGKDLTPFLLARIAELSQGQSVKANRALLLNNAKTAAAIAVAASR